MLSRICILMELVVNLELKEGNVKNSSTVTMQRILYYLFYYFSIYYFWSGWGGSRIYPEECFLLEPSMSVFRCNVTNARCCVDEEEVEVSGRSHMCAHHWIFGSTCTVLTLEV